MWCSFVTRWSLFSTRTLSQQHGSKAVHWSRVCLQILNRCCYLEKQPRFMFDARTLRKATKSQCPVGCLTGWTWVICPEETLAFRCSGSKWHFPSAAGTRRHPRVNSIAVVESHSQSSSPWCRDFASATPSDIYVWDKIRQHTWISACKKMLPKPPFWCLPDDTTPSEQAGTQESNIAMNSSCTENKRKPAIKCCVKTKRQTS